MHLAIRNPRYKLAEEAYAELNQLRSAPLVGPVAAKIPDGDLARELVALAETLEGFRPEIERRTAAENPGKLEIEPDWIYGSQGELALKLGYGSKNNSGLMARLKKEGQIKDYQPAGNSFRFLMPTPRQHEEIKAHFASLPKRKRKPRRKS